jgi:uncharacterized protein YciI
MPFIIETFDKPDHKARRLAARDAHLDFLEASKALLLACGAKLDEAGDATGGLYIVDVESPAEAEAFIARDPFTEAGLFERVQVTRWRKAFLDGKGYLPPR